MADLRSTLSGETVLVIGGTGSFGRAFVRYALADSALDVRIVSMSRNAEMRYQLEQAHLEDVRAGRLTVAPGDVRYAADLDAVAAFRPTAVIHAAAEKHVGTGEQFARYTWDVNYGGAVNVIRFAKSHQIPRCLLLSTDKATLGLRGEEPANEYGRSKRAAEQAFIEAESGTTRFAATRYGNVVASSGSVLPLFLEQRKAGTLTLTDRRMTRFAMPLAPNGHHVDVQWADGSHVVSAVDLVLDALASMRGSEVFVPNIPSHTVADLARAVGRDCQIAEVGIRPGERLHEVLISPAEARRTWVRPHGGWVILPRAECVYREGYRVPPEFHFSSDQAPMPVAWKEAA